MTTELKVGELYKTKIINGYKPNFMKKDDDRAFNTFIPVENNLIVMFCGMKMLNTLFYNKIEFHKILYLNKIYYINPNSISLIEVQNEY